MRHGTCVVLSVKCEKWSVDCELWSDSFILQGYLLWHGRHFGTWEVTTRRWMCGVGRISRCPSGSGSAAECWRPSPAAESVTSSGPSTRTASLGTRTPTASTPHGRWRCGWRSTRDSSTCTGQTCSTLRLVRIIIVIMDQT